MTKYFHANFRKIKYFNLNNIQQTTNHILFSHILQAFKIDVHGDIRNIDNARVLRTSFMFGEDSDVDVNLIKNAPDFIFIRRDMLRIFIKHPHTGHHR